MLQTINSALGDQSLSENHLSEAFDVWWPKLESQFERLPAEEQRENPVRPEREILEEILALLRSQAREVSAVPGSIKRVPLKPDPRVVDDSAPAKPTVVEVKAEFPKPDGDDDSELEKD